MCNISKIDKKIFLFPAIVSTKWEQLSKKRNVKNKSNCKETAEYCKQRYEKITHRTLDNES